MVAKASCTNLRGLGTMKLSLVIPDILVATKPGKMLYRIIFNKQLLYNYISYDTCITYLYNYPFTRVLILESYSEVVNKNLAMVNISNVVVYHVTCYLGSTINT